LRGDEVA